MRARWLFFLPWLAACGDPSGTEDRSAPPEVDWVVSLESADPGRRLSPALLGQYDLSGELFHYDRVPGLAEALRPAGFRDWRFGAGRWEAGTYYLPSLTDGSPCPESPVAEAYAPSGWTDEDLLAARDWFVDDGRPVTLEDTSRDDRYDLDYLRRFLDVAEAFGVDPFVSIDLMPRALAANRTPFRSEANTPTACVWSYANQVSNTKPADPEVFAAAAAGLVERIVEGTDGAEPRRVGSWELWNEPDLCVFWDPLFDDGTPCVYDPFDARLRDYLAMARPTLVALDRYRSRTDDSFAKTLRFGIGSFAFADVAAAVIALLDENPLPDGSPVPLDFISFHSYNHDPLGIVSFIETVAAARAGSSHYRDSEIVLAEWGPFPDQPFDAGNMDQPLRIATVLAIGATLGLDRAYHTIFWDYWGDDVVKWGLVTHDVRPRPLHRAYELFHELIGDGADRLSVAGYGDGRVEHGQAAVIAARDDGGTIRALLVNRLREPRTARVDLDGSTETPTEVRVFDEPSEPARSVPTGRVVTVPGRSLALVELRGD